MTIDFSIVLHWMVAYGLALARPLAMLSLNPVFTRAQITGLIRGAVATALASPIIPHLAAVLPVEGNSPIMLLLLALKEAVIGAALGLLLGAPFWALDVAGDVLDAQRGATQGRLNDPAGFEDVSITGTMLVLTGIVVFVMTGGLEMLSDLLYQSWGIWSPLGTLPQVDGRIPRFLLGILDQITRQGLLMATPPVLAMLLCDAGLMIVARIAPQLRIDDLALSARNVVFSIVMTVYALFLLTYMRQDLSILPSLLDRLRDALPGSNAAVPH